MKNQIQKWEEKRSEVNSPSSTEKEQVVSELIYGIEFVNLLFF